MVGASIWLDSKLRPMLCGSSSGRFERRHGGDDRDEHPTRQSVIVLLTRSSTAHHTEYQ